MLSTAVRLGVAYSCQQGTLSYGRLSRLFSQVARWGGPVLQTHQVCDLVLRACWDTNSYAQPKEDVEQLIEQLVAFGPASFLPAGRVEKDGYWVGIDSEDFVKGFRWSKRPNRVQKACPSYFSLTEMIIDEAPEVNEEIRCQMRDRLSKAMSAVAQIKIDRRSAMRTNWTAAEGQFDDAHEVVDCVVERVELFEPCYAQTNSDINAALTSSVVFSQKIVPRTDQNEVKAAHGVDTDDWGLGQGSVGATDERWWPPDPRVMHGIVRDKHDSACMSSGSGSSGLQGVKDAGRGEALPARGQCGRPPDMGSGGMTTMGDKVSLLEAMSWSLNQCGRPPEVSRADDVIEPVH